MADTIRFHPDENMDPDIALALRAYGVDITTTSEKGLRAADDVEHLEFALIDGSL